MEELYREIRALRIYEGASELQKLIIARATIENYEVALKALGVPPERGPNWNAGHRLSRRRETS